MTDLNSTSKTSSYLETLSKQLKALKSLECFTIWPSHDYDNFFEQHKSESHTLLLGYNKNGDIEGHYVGPGNTASFCHEAERKFREPYYALGVISEYPWRDTINYGLTIYSPIQTSDGGKHLVMMDSWSLARYITFEHPEEILKMIKRSP